MPSISGLVRKNVAVSDIEKMLCSEKVSKALYSIAEIHQFCMGARSCQMIPRNNLCDGYFDCYDREFIIIHLVAVDPHKKRSVQIMIIFRFDESGCHKKNSYSNANNPLALRYGKDYQHLF